MFEMLQLVYPTRVDLAKKCKIVNKHVLMFDKTKIHILTMSSFLSKSNTFIKVDNTLLYYQE